MHASLSARAPMRRDTPHAASVRPVNPPPPSQFIPKRAAPKRRFHQADQGDLGDPVLSAKIIRFALHPNHPYNSRHPAPMRGAYRDRHGRWARDAMDAAASGARGIAGRASACERSAGAQTTGA
jgi:hypothetical protein